jgi:hypothetical protein
MNFPMFILLDKNSSWLDSIPGSISIILGIGLILLGWFLVKFIFYLIAIPITKISDAISQTIADKKNEEELLNAIRYLYSNG